MPKSIVLASASPRRQDLLAKLGVDFVTSPADIVERQRDGESPARFAVRMALEKAEVVARQVTEPSVVIGADTIVVLDGRILGKPRSPHEARDFLRLLRGRWHEVITGVAVMNTTARTTLAESDRTAPDSAATSPGLVGAKHETTRVMLREFTDDEIEAYVASGDPLDKAGAYAIQNEDFRPVQSMMGSWSNVVGLPLGLTAELLDAAGVVVPSPQALPSDEPYDR